MPCSTRLFVLVLGSVVPVWACADDDAPERAIDVSAFAPGAGNNEAPRFVRSDRLAEAQPSLPGFRSESTELGYRWWSSKGRADLGMGLGTLAYVSRPVASTTAPGDGVANVLASGTVLTLGMRYRTSARSALYADAARWYGSGLDGGDAVVGKVGVEFKAAQSQWNIAYGGLGLRLAGDTRMTLRLRRGGLGVYWRSSF